MTGIPLHFLSRLNIQFIAFSACCASVLKAFVHDNLLVKYKPKYL